MIPAALVRRDKALLNSVQRATIAFVDRAMPDLEQVSQNGAGAVFRELATGTLDQFGNTARIASTASYEDMRASVVSKATPLNVKTPFSVTPEVVDPAVGYAMGHFVAGDFVGASTALASSVGLLVADTYRSTSRYLSERDPYAVSMQRIAGPRACAFCAYAATMSTRYQQEINGAEIFQSMEKFHARCGCSLVPLFKNVSVFRAPYMNDMEDHIDVAMRDIRDMYDYAIRQPGAREMKRREFFQTYPDTALTTENIAKRLRLMNGYR